MKGGRGCSRGWLALSLIIHMSCVGGGGGCKLCGGGGRVGVRRKCFLHKYFSAQNPGTVATGMGIMNGWA